jgi:hypothetical protein
LLGAVIVAGEGDGDTGVGVVRVSMVIGGLLLAGWWPKFSWTQSARADGEHTG